MRPPFPPSRFAPLVVLADAWLRRSIRLEIDDPAGVLGRARAGEPMIFACRHGELWPLLWTVSGTGVAVMTSRSGDGELLSRVLDRMGFEVFRGSTSADAFSAGRSALRVLRRDGRVGLAVDGPRGPRGVVGDGALRLAQRADVPIVALRRRAGRPWVAPGSWDRFEIPRPGDTVGVAVAPPLHVASSPSGVDEAGQRLADLLGGHRLPVRSTDGTPEWTRPSADLP